MKYAYKYRILCRVLSIDSKRKNDLETHGKMILLANCVYKATRSKYNTTRRPLPFSQYSVLSTTHAPISYGPGNLYHH